MDVNCACAGFVYALDMARRYLVDDEYKTILIVSSEMLSKITDYTDRSTCVLFGDG
ncbi:MAG: ketoacyl-ACP synthase III, partial [Oscillospiraceae bacterium]